MRIDIYHHFPNTDESKLDEILSNQKLILKNLSIMSEKEDQMQAALDSINSETNDIAAEVDALKAQAAGGISPDKATDFINQLTGISTRLTAIAAPPAAPAAPATEAAPGS